MCIIRTYCIILLNSIPVSKLTIYNNAIIHSFCIIFFNDGSRRTKTGTLSAIGTGYFA